jgi:hypothetical protein
MARRVGRPAPLQEVLDVLEGLLAPEAAQAREPIDDEGVDERTASA